MRTPLSGADRRVARTRSLLQNSLIELLRNSNYDTISIQNIVDFADVGRTTFYLHYKSKDELLVSCHESILTAFSADHFLSSPLSRNELLASGPSPGLTQACNHLLETQAHLYPVFHGKDSPLILRQMRDRIAATIETDLRAVLKDNVGAIRVELLAVYLAGAQLALVQWCLEKRGRLSAEDLARTLHQMRRAAICDALKRD